MQYSTTFIMLLFFNISALSENKTKNVFISGVAKNFNNEIKIEDFSEHEDLRLLASTYSFLPDSNGHFSISFHIKKANYFKIGRNVVYLSPGTRMNVYLDYNWPDSAKFMRGSRLENAYLKSIPFTFMGSFLEGGDNIKNTITETITEVLRLSIIRTSKLNSIKNISREFKSLEIVRIKADVINSLHYLNFYFPYVHKLTGDSLLSFQKNYQDSVIPSIKKFSKGFLNHKFLKLHVYRNILGIVMKYSNSSGADTATISDWLAAKKLVHEIKSVGEKQNILTFKSKINTIRSPEYKTSVLETFNKLLTFNGDSAIDFVMADSSGRLTHLNSFKGKVIYIDLWATWCGPCMEEKPFMDSIIKYYEKKPGVKIISLSIDGDKIAWVKHLKKRNYQGMQLIVDRAQLDFYHVSEIPRAIIIDKEFKIAAMRAPKPSDNETKQVIDSLLRN
jgi:thiol-disulfide isomerase/thioredoxin